MKVQRLLFGVLLQIVGIASLYANYGWPLKDFVLVQRKIDILAS